MTCDVTYEELAAFRSGGLPNGRAREVEGHAVGCDVCRRRLSTLAEADAALRELPQPEPPARAVLAARRALTRDRRGPQAGPEIITLDEVAAFLRVSLDELEEVAAGLPMFELGGRVRVRRSRLNEWIEQRERDYMRNNTASRVALTLAANGWKGVA